MKISNYLRFTGAALATALIGLSSAQAETYNQLVAQDSSVGFTYEQMGVRMDGEFREFAATLSFDPAQVDQAQASFQVNLGSVDLGAPDFDAELQKPDWFNTKAFPDATFESKSIASKADNLYEVQGVLTIKGEQQLVTFDAKFEQKADQGLFSGEFTIERAAFKIGEGSWSSFDIVANDVLVRFNLAATAQ